MNKRQCKKHGGATRPRRRSRGDIAVEEGSGNIFRDLDLPDPDRRLRDAEHRLWDERARKSEES